jgi:hypothetical protein
MKPHSRLLAASFLFAAACASPVAIGRTLDTRQVDLREFQHLQDVFRSKYTPRSVHDFENHGRVTVRDVSLDGFPGHSYVRCRFHYQNRTAKPVVQAWISLDVLDKDGRVVSTQSCHCVMPTATAIERGLYYSDELRTPTYDAHLHPDWSWQIRCVADQQVEDEPLNPPAPGYLPQNIPPMWIKDRNFPYYEERAQRIEALNQQSR